MNKHWPEQDEDSSEHESEEETEESEASDTSSEEDELVDENGRWKLGAKLEAKWIDGEYYHGTITRVYKKASYSFRFDDDDFLRSVPHKEIRRRTPIVPFGQRDVEDKAEESESEEEEDEPEFGSKKYYVRAVREFLVSQLENHEYFVHGTRTNNTESFHNVCNKYYQKGLTLSFPQYIMRKTFAALDWNENKLGMRTDSPIADWKEVLLLEFLRRKAAIRGAQSAKNARK